jgi:hypothetical protein
MGCPLIGYEIELHQADGSRDCSIVMAGNNDIGARSCAARFLRMSAQAAQAVVSQNSTVVFNLALSSGTPVGA